MKGERVVAALCVRVKSHELALRSLTEVESWYVIGSLVRLARAGYQTVELLALDAVTAVVLRRSLEGYDAVRSASRTEEPYELDWQALLRSPFVTRPYWFCTHLGRGSHIFSRRETHSH